MRKAFYIILIAAAFLIPTEPQNLESLRPVEVIRISRTEEGIQIETDMGDTGVGATVELALANLKTTASGAVYLNTTGYLLVSEDAIGVINALRPYLKGSTRLCEADREADLETVSEYLRAHPPEKQLKHYKISEKLQKLTLKNGRNSV